MKLFHTEQYGRANCHHSCTENPDSEKFERHCHSSYELIYVIRGEGKYVVESAEYPLFPNTVLLLRPYEYHYVCPRSDCAYERYVIHFSEEMFIDATKSIPFINPQGVREPGIYFPHMEASEKIRAQFELLDLFIGGDGEGSTDSPTRIETLLRTTINQILLLLSFLQPDAPYPAENELVGSLMKYLNEHLTESISLEEMARSFFISKYHLCHTFRERTGTSVISYLTTKRIALAQQHLEDGIPAIRVAELVGFRDYSVFYRAYRKIVGQSPSHAKGIGKRERRFGS